MFLCPHISILSDNPCFATILQHAVALTHTTFSGTVALSFAISSILPLVLGPMTVVGFCGVVSLFLPTLILSNSCQVNMLAISYAGSPAVSARQWWALQCVGGGIVMLKDKVVLASENICGRRVQVIVKNVYILCCIQVAINFNKMASVPIANASPEHNTLLIGNSPRLYAGGLVSLSCSVPHNGSAITFR